MQQWGHGVGRPVHDQQLRAGFLGALGWAGMRTLTLTLAGASPHLPSHPLTSPRLGVSALKAFSLARTAWASWAVSSGPLGVGWADMGPEGVVLGRASTDWGPRMGPGIGVR